MIFNRMLIGSFVIVGFAANAAPAPKHPVSMHEVETTKTVGGAPMFSTKNIIENAVNSKDHTKLVEAVKAANLVETLKSPGPFTVFAPDNAAFEKLPKPTIDALMKPEGHAGLAKILTYHVIPMKLDAKAIGELIKKGKGVAKLKTVAGGILLARMEGTTLVLEDENKGIAHGTILDIYQSNGVIHSIDTVLQPK